MFKNIMLVAALAMSSNEFKLQVQNNVIPSGGTTTIAFDYPNQDANLLTRLWCDKAVVKNYSAAEIIKSPVTVSGTTASFEWRMTTPKLADGVRSCFVTVYQDLAGTILESSPSNTITLVIANQPPAPTNLRRIVTAIQGLLDELVTELEKSIVK